MIAYPDDHPRGCACATCTNARNAHRAADVELRRRQASRGSCHCGSAYKAHTRADLERCDRRRR